MKNRVCAVIVTYNIGSEILTCFNSVKDQVQEVIIIDNGSERQNLKILDQIKTTNKVKVFFLDTNLGIAAALNIGVIYALKNKYEWLLTLDHDSEASSTLVQDLLGKYYSLEQKQQFNVGILVPNLFDRNSQSYLGNDVYRIVNKNFFELRVARCSGSLMKTNLFSKVGLFNEDLFVYYVDDEFCLRARLYGYKTYLYTTAIMCHSEGNKYVKKFLWKKVIYDNYGNLARYYIARNTIFMVRKYYLEYTYCCSLVRRLFVDALKVTLYDCEKRNRLWYMFKGITDACRSRYGKAELPGN